MGQENQEYDAVPDTSTRTMLIRRVTSPLWWLVVVGSVGCFVFVRHWVGFGWAQVVLIAGVGGAVLVDRRLVARQRRRP